MLTLRLLEAAVCFPLLPAQTAPPAGENAQWRALSFLEGTWDAQAKTGAAGSYTFRRELDGRVLARHSFTKDCKGPDDSTCQHRDLLYVFQDAPGQSLKAIYFDNEGHVIRYSVSVPAPNTAEFVSDATTPGPQFRLTYELKGAVMDGKFQIRMPGKAEWASYLEWSGSKQGAPRAQAGTVPDVWAPVRFLVGTWEGEANGQPGAGHCVREYRFVLNNKYLEVRNKSTYPAQPKNPKGEIHEDWGMISYDRTRRALVLRQFHIEGFVNQYVSGPLGESPLRFTSEAIENIPAGFRARETYTVTGPDSFVERFELAEPGKDFEVYSETRFRRTK